MPSNRRVNPQDYNKNPLQPNQDEDPNANPVDGEEVDAMSTFSADDNNPQQGSSNNMMVFGERGNGLNSQSEEHPTIQQIYSRRPQHQIFVNEVDMAQARRRFLGGSSHFVPGSRDYYGMEGGSLLHHYVEEEEEEDEEEKEEEEEDNEGGMPYQIHVWIHISNIHSLTFNENDNAADNNDDNEAP